MPRIRKKGDSIEKEKRQVNWRNKSPKKVCFVEKVRANEARQFPTTQLEWEILPERKNKAVMKAQGEKNDHYNDVSKDGQK